MIYIIKLISGEEYIGKFDEAEPPKSDSEYYNIVGPMVIVDGQDEHGGVNMKLRDGMMLSDDDLISFPSKFVLAYYPASKVMEEYYSKAIIYCRQHTKNKIEMQIKEATEQLDDVMSEKNIEKALEELRLRNFNLGNGTVN